MQRFICDTNFVIRYLLADQNDMFEETKKIFDQAQNGQISVVLLESVFTEIIYVLSSFYKVPKSDIAETLSALVAYKGIQADKALFIEALKLYKKHNLHIVDCLLAVNSNINNFELLSFDKKLKKP